MKKKYDLNLNEIGARLKAVRETLDMTLDKMNKLTGFSTSLISAAENGLKKPSAIYLCALLDHFDVNINYILSGKGQVFLPKPKDEKGKAHFTDTYEEMLYMLEHVEMVKYALMTEYIGFKIHHANEINQLLGEKKHS